MIKEYTFVLGQSSCEIAFAITKIPKDKHYIGKEMVQYYPMEILYKNITHTHTHFFRINPPGVNGGRVAWRTDAGIVPSTHCASAAGLGRTLARL